MPRKLDTEGEVVEPIVEPPPSGFRMENVRVTIPLWKWGNIEYSVDSVKGSIAIIVFVAILVLMPILAIIEIFTGPGGGVSALLGKLGEAMLLVLGVLLGVSGNNSK